MADKSPDAYRTISEASEETGLPAHVLRFWEGRFAQLKPMKRAGGRRLYRPQDVSLLKGLKRLLYEDGYTIKGAQKYLREHGVGAVAALGEGEGDAPITASPAGPPGSSETYSEPALSQDAPAASSHPAAAISDEARSRLEAALERVEAARNALAEALENRSAA
ncbi:MAG: MerR family transcriptional regulator [Oceanicaulis sp.]